MCTLIRYLGCCTLIRYLFLFLFFKYPSLLFNWMFEHDCLDKCCFGCLRCMCLYYCICTCSAQLSMFHMERHSRNTLIILISARGINLLGPFQQLLTCRLIVLRIPFLLPDSFSDSFQEALCLSSGSSTWYAKILNPRGPESISP